MEYNKDANVKARHNKNTHYIKNMNVLKTIVCFFKESKHDYWSSSKV